MSDPFIGEIKMFAGNFAPRNYALCNGQLIAISQNTALFSILGTTYGGNGQTTFALPNLQGRIPMHAGNGAGLTPRVLGEQGGTENVTILTNNLPSHHHGLSQANAKAAIGTRTEAPTTTHPGNAFLGAGNIYVGGQSAPNQGLNIASISFASGAATDLTGNSQPMSILPPFLAVNFIICMFGIFPSRN